MFLFVSKTIKKLVYFPVRLGRFSGSSKEDIDNNNNVSEKNNYRNNYSNNDGENNNYTDDSTKYDPLLKINNEIDDEILLWLMISNINLNDNASIATTNTTTKTTNNLVLSTENQFSYIHASYIWKNASMKNKIFAIDLLLKVLVCIENNSFILDVFSYYIYNEVITSVNIDPKNMVYNYNDNDSNYKKTNGESGSGYNDNSYNGDTNNYGSDHTSNNNINVDLFNQLNNSLLNFQNIFMNLISNKRSNENSNFLILFNSILNDVFSSILHDRSVFFIIPSGDVQILKQNYLNFLNKITYITIKNNCQFLIENKSNTNDNLSLNLLQRLYIMNGYINNNGYNKNYSLYLNCNVTASLDSNSQNCNRKMYEKINEKVHERSSSLSINKELKTSFDILKKKIMKLMKKKLNFELQLHYKNGILLRSHMKNLLFSSPDIQSSVLAPKGDFILGKKCVSDFKLFVYYTNICQLFSLSLLLSEFLFCYFC